MTPTPIQFSRSYQTSDGKCYATLVVAQAVEIQRVLSASLAEDNAKVAAEAIVANKDAIMSILTLTDKSRPRARGKSKSRNGSKSTLAAGLPTPN